LSDCGALAAGISCVFDHQGCVVSLPGSNTFQGLLSGEEPGVLQTKGPELLCAGVPGVLHARIVGMPLLVYGVVQGRCFFHAKALTGRGCSPRCTPACFCFLCGCQQCDFRAAAVVGRIWGCLEVAAGQGSGAVHSFGSYSSSLQYITGSSRQTARAAGRGFCCFFVLCGDWFVTCMQG
jgi:hypothetical protein